MDCVYRYLKNVFPKVDETILLDILEQSDNNVQKASERLIDLGYEKRNPTLPAKAIARKKEEEQVMNWKHTVAFRAIYTVLFIERINSFCRHRLSQRHRHLLHVLKVWKKRIRVRIL